MELKDAILIAEGMRDMAAEKGMPIAFEVVKTAKGYEAQVFGTHALFKSHKLIEVFPVNGLNAEK